MSDPNAEQEPSMEEILASIRRIISEDGDEEESAEAAAPEEAPEPESVADEAAPEPEPEPDPEPAEEVLELTDEVQDDGTVVNLKTGEEVDEEPSAAEEDV
jgi:cell pole-organizing protein PopZ